MLEIHSPNRLKGVLVDGDPIINNISLESAVLVNDDFVEAVVDEVLSQKQGLVVLDWQDADFCDEGRQVHVILDPVDVEVGGREELGLLILWALPV